MHHFSFTHKHTQGFTGDGFVCRPRDSCLALPGLCDVNAECAPGPPGATGPEAGRCRCRENFVGDGHKCEGDVGRRDE